MTRELAERAYFLLCSGLGRLLRAGRYSKTRIVARDGDLHVRKHRLFYAPLLVWLGGRLVIEVDGGQHNEPHGEAKDSVRTAWLRSQGFEVLRFWNNDVMRNGEGCQEIIAQAVERRRALSFLR